jgi:alpha-amylase
MPQQAINPNPNNYPWCFKKGASQPTPQPAPTPPTPNPGPAPAGGGTFVHLFEWSWDDIAQECTQFLGPNGYDAVQISPPMEHIPGDQWWTRYQPVSYGLISRSGDRAAMIRMIDTCHKAGVKIYAGKNMLKTV